ncbi:hypothetical protein [Leuconostoc mesenteroides]|uniref:hypothetical protein n=1 Tax=Leuconostoc mesenteroides TaxID=1245 RepID=UPI002362ACED|nr:hypothetical protein [Leuconostoc mesenteroides]
MEKLILTIITAFVSAGGLGYLNYQILEAQGSLNIEDGSKSQTMWIGILGMVNFGLFLLISKYEPLITSFFLTMVVSALMFFIFGRKIFELYWRFINIKSSTVSDEDPWEKFTKFKKSEEALIFIFDFEDKLIEQGWFVSANDSRSKTNGLMLEPCNFEDKSIESVYDYIANKQLTRTYVDINRKVKYFAVIFDA